MRNDQTPERLVSWFAAPVTTKKPLRNMPLSEIYEYIVTDFLKVVSEKVRGNPSLKKDLLPSFTASGTFLARKRDCLLTYSGYIILDFDNCELKYFSILTTDQVLKPVLVFRSPSGKGIKMVVYVKNGTAENHLRYFNAISLYILETYGLEIDSSGSDLARLCFLCMDENAYFSYDGFIESEILLSMLPPSPAAPVKNEQEYKPPAVKYGKETISQPYTEDNRPPSYYLNRHYSVHARAEADLKAYGWQQNGLLWTRPGKSLKEGCSAIYNLYEAEGIHFFTVFTSSDPHFGRRGYTDCQIINICEFGNWQSCITELAREYLP